MGDKRLTPILVVVSRLQDVEVPEFEHFVVEPYPWKTGSV